MLDASLHKKLIEWSVVFSVYNKPFKKTRFIKISDVNVYITIVLL